MAFNALWLQNVDYPARVDRAVFDNIWTAGVLGATSLFVEPSTPVAMSVDVGSGVAVVAGTDQLFQGKYLCREQAPTVGVAIAAAPGSGTRHDIVVLQVRDPNASGAAGDDAIISVIEGTASLTPVDPTLPPSCLPLARVRVSSGTGSITSSLIDDLRVAAVDAYNTLAPASVSLADLTAQVQQMLVPTGTVSAFAGSVAPAGWLLCDGSAYTTVAMPDLFAVIGNAYNTSGGQSAPPAGSFRVPLLTGRVPVGRDASQPEFDALGDTGGSKAVTLTAAQSGLVGHDHSVALSGTTANNNANHTHAQAGTFGSTTESANHTHAQSGSFTSSGQSASHDHGGATTFNGTHDHSIDVQGMVTQSHAHSSTSLDSVAGKPNPSTGSAVVTSQPINNNGSHQHSFLTGVQSVDHSHTVTISGSTGTVSANHSHSVTISGSTGSNSANHAHTFSASGTSGSVASAPASQAHDNLQPYGVVNYIIKA